MKKDGWKLLLDSKITLTSEYFWFTRGTVFSIGYRLKGYGFLFTGICIKTRKKSLLKLTSTFLMRNIFAKVAVELHVILYGICRLNFKLLEYARKHFFYRSSKLYYLRDKLNNDSWVDD